MAQTSLADFLKSGEDWGTMATTEESVFVQKLPAYKGQQARLGVLVNPVDPMGSPTKKRGILIRSVDEYEAFKKVFAGKGIPKLIEMLEKVNPETGKRQPATGVIQIT